MLPRLLLTGLLLLTVLPITATAGMYSYVDGRGIRHYTNVPGTSTYAINEHTSRKVLTPEDKLVRTITHKPTLNWTPSPWASSRMYRAYAWRPFLKDVPQALNRYIQLAAMNHRVDPLLIKAVIRAESNFNTYARSPKGAQGLMQLMPGTAHDMDVDNPYDPSQNIDGGARYLRAMLDTFNGDVALSLAAYNAGPARVSSGMIPNIPETQEYVARVLANYRQYKLSGNTSPAPSSTSGKGSVPR